MAGKPLGISHRSNEHLFLLRTQHFPHYPHIGGNNRPLRERRLHEHPTKPFVRGSEQERIRPGNPLQRILLPPCKHYRFCNAEMLRIPLPLLAQWPVAYHHEPRLRILLEEPLKSSKRYFPPLLLRHSPYPHDDEVELRKPTVQRRHLGYTLEYPFHIYPHGKLHNPTLIHAKRLHEAARHALRNRTDCAALLKVSCRLLPQFPPKPSIPREPRARVIGVRLNGKRRPCLPRHRFPHHSPPERILRYNELRQRLRMRQGGAKTTHTEPHPQRRSGAHTEVMHSKRRRGYLCLTLASRACTTRYHNDR